MKRNLLNVKSILERVVRLQRDYVENSTQYPGQRMAPIFEDELRQIAFLARARLNKIKPGDRHDIRI